jgi:catechol 2,3-dioxygenase-like lactoylglutathione lyase family enzyme
VLTPHGDVTKSNFYQVHGVRNAYIRTRKEVIMFDHISLKVRDFRKSLAFYRAALAPLGFEAQHVDEQGKSAGFGPKGSVGLWIAEGTPQSSAHVAFASKSRDAVAKFHDAGLRAGGKDNGKAGLRLDYAKDYYAAFLLDPDGNNVEAVSHGG